MPEDAPLDPVAKAALVVNLLTEDNLPSYHREIATRFGRDGAWGTWVGQWTAEEGRHSIALRDYLVVTRGVGAHHTRTPTYGTHDRRIRGGKRRWQHLPTYRSRNSRPGYRTAIPAGASSCPVADQLLSRVAIDENLHMVFYRNVMAAALDIAPDAAMNAIRDEVIGFAMPGIGMTDFPEGTRSSSPRPGFMTSASTTTTFCNPCCGSGASSTGLTSALKARRPEPTSRSSSLSSTSGRSITKRRPKPASASPSASSCSGKAADRDKPAFLTAGSILRVARQQCAFRLSLICQAAVDSGWFWWPAAVAAAVSPGGYAA